MSLAAEFAGSTIRPCRLRCSWNSRLNAIHFSHTFFSVWRFQKRHSFWPIFFFIACALATPAMAQFTGPEEQQSPSITTGIVTEVIFHGNHALSSDELSTVVSTKAVSSFSHTLHGLPFHLLGSDYESLSQPALQRDTAALNQYYHNHGFIEAKSSYQVIPNRDDLHNYFEYIRRERLTKTPGQSTGSLPPVRDTVIFTIDEGRPFTISHVSIEGLESLPNEFQTELNDKITIKKGERWSLTAEASEVQRIVNILIQNGYPNVRSDTTKVQWEPDSGTVRLLLYIHPGHRYKYGPVHIVYDSAYGNKSTIDHN
ncbi:MAG TPA: POTRA domain-containing protein, partial [Candidatus Kapabacteria bacterium]